MPNPDGTPDADEQALIDGLNLRIAAAGSAFKALNEIAGEERYGPPSDWAIQGAVVALCKVLVRAGLTSNPELTIITALTQAELLETTLEEARMDLKERSGKAPGLGWITRPQG